jgi:hypothetical protein
MNVPFLIGGIIVLLAVIGSAIYVVHQAALRRTEQLKEMAGRMNFTFTPEAESNLLQELSQFHLFKQGRSKKIRNVLTGQAGDMEVRLFDYQFTTGSGQHSSTHHQTVMLFESQKLQFADFELRPEHLFHKIGGAFGYQDIDFDDSPEFSKQYLLRGPDERAVRDVFQRPIRKHLEGQRRVSAEGAGGRLVFYRMGKRVKPEELREFIKDGVQLLTLMAG